MSKTPEEIAALAANAAEEKKAKDIVILDIKDVSVICDYFVICSGNSSTQVKAISEFIEEKLSEAGHHYMRREGFQDSHWVLMDYGSVVIHIFQEEDRMFYNLERLWGDAQVVHFL